MEKASKIYIAGHQGLVGSAILQRLQEAGYKSFVFRTHQELDLTRQKEVEEFFDLERPDYIFLAAAKVGGIWANSIYPAEFIYSNLAVQTNVIHVSYLYKAKKLLFLGSSCIYPKHCPQPMKEEHLLSGHLEPTNEPYAVAKIAGIKMCQSYNQQYKTRFISVMPTNLFGPNDTFDLETSHVLPALIRKIHLAKLAAQGDWKMIVKDETKFGPIPDEILNDLVAISRSHGHSTPTSFHRYHKNAEHSGAITVWGTGIARREFMHVDDLADACLFLMNNYEESDIINIGTGEDISILELTEMIKEIVKFEGSIRFDRSKPDGTPRKQLDISKLRSLGWRSHISLREGIEMTYRWYLDKVGQ